MRLAFGLGLGSWGHPPSRRRPWGARLSPTATRCCRAPRYASHQQDLPFHARGRRERRRSQGLPHRSKGESGEDSKEILSLRLAVRLILKPIFRFDSRRRSRRRLRTSFESEIEAADGFLFHGFHGAAAVENEGDVLHVLIHEAQHTPQGRTLVRERGRATAKRVCWDFRNDAVRPPRRMADGTARSRPH